MNTESLLTVLRDDRYSGQQGMRIQAADQIERLTAENERLRACIELAERELVNLQPHIPQSCIPGHEPFIDSHVDAALEQLRKCTNQQQPTREEK